MTITRADVEKLLSLCERTRQPNEGVIAELCRAWLAVDDAPSGETTGFSTAAVTFDTHAYIPAGTYKLVCIDTPTGGREGLW